LKKPGLLSVGCAEFSDQKRSNSAVIAAIEAEIGKVLPGKRGFLNVNAW
jgi:hypothetical protein